MKQKAKMQNVSFNSVDEFLEFLPADELKIVEVLRKIIFNAVPDIKEKLSYNIPFYSRHKNIFFIWPASVLWGTKKSYEGVSGLFIHEIGNRFIFAILAASASYIAVPAAMRLAAPKADPGLYIPMALGITFPFNITIGMPLYYLIVNSI